MAKLCSKCFKNEGIKIEAYRLGTRENTACPNCGSKDGNKLSRPKIYALFKKFFVHGTASQNIGGYAPVLQLSNDPSAEYVRFSSNIADDYELLKKYCGQVLYHYSAPLWHFGMTEHYNAIEDGGSHRDWAIEEIIEQAQIVKLPVGSKIYRARINMPPHSISAEQFDPPPFKRPESYDRFDNAEVRIFYAAFEIETCLHECRVTVADEIALATFKVKKELRILNLADSFSKEGELTPFESIECLMDGLCSSRLEEYDKCRFISSAIQKTDADGFKYKSYFSLVKERTLSNLALFGEPVKEQKVELESINRVKLERVDYEYSFGPHSNDYNPDREKFLEQLKEVLRKRKNCEAGYDSEKALNEIEAILGKMND